MDYPTKGVTPVGRISYPALFVPKAMKDKKGNEKPGAEKKYSVQLIFPKTDKEGLKALKLMVKAAIARGVAENKDWDGEIPEDLKLPIHDGDEVNEKKDRPELIGMWYITASSREKDKPSVIDRFGNELTTEKELYAGCYGMLSINAFPYATGNNFGVSFGLNNVLKVKDGEPFGAGPSNASNDFKDFIKVPAAKAKVSDFDEDEEEDEAPAPAKKKKAPAPSLDLDEEEDEAPTPAPKKKKAPVVDLDLDEGDEPSTPSPKKKKRANPFSFDEDDI